MAKFLVRRLLQMIPLLLGISIIVFFLTAMMPGDAVDAKVNPNMTQEQILHLKEMYGLTDPIPVRYVKWLVNAVQLDFGDSLTYLKPVTSVINDYMWNSFILSLIAFILQLVIAIPIGIVSATRQYSAVDTAGTVFALLGISLPSFFLGLLFQKIFAIDLQWLPLSGMSTAGANYTGFAHYWDVFLHLLMPILVLSLVSAGAMMRYVRTAMLEVIHQDYIRTARAKGLSEKVVIYKHALRNAMIPVITYIGFSLPTLFSGAMITEKVFGFPGIGKVAYDAIIKRDYPLYIGFTMFVAVLTLLGNLLADILYAAADPRIKME